MPQTIQVFEDNNILFLKAFLLDASTNINGWGVDPTTLAQNIKSYIGKPLVMQDDFNHPMSDDTYDHHLQYQESFRIGNIIDIVEKEGIYSAIIEITNKNASEAFKAGNLPLYVSPQIYHYDAGKEPDNAASGWKATHLAVVDKPAFGVKKARIISQCSGDVITCSAQLKKASLTTTKCNCVKQAIANFKVATNNKHEINSSLGNKHTKVSVEDDNAKVSGPSLEEFEKLKQENVSLKAGLSEKDAVINQLKTGHDEAINRIAAIEKSTRTEKIANILSGVKFETDEQRQTKIDTLVGSNLEVAFIQDTWKQALQEPKVEVKSANVETKLPLKQAVTEDSAGAKPAWLITYENSVGGSY